MTSSDRRTPWPKQPLGYGTKGGCVGCVTAIVLFVAIAVYVSTTIDVY